MVDIKYISKTKEDIFNIKKTRKGKKYENESFFKQN